MTLSLHWFLPTAGDSRDIVGFGPVEARRPATLDYLALEEAWWFGEGVIPRLRSAGLLAARTTTGDHGDPSCSPLQPSLS